MSQTTLATIPRLIMQVLTIYDVAPKPILQKANIDIDNIEQRVAMEKMQCLWQLAVQATNNAELGLVAASLFQPTYLKGLGLAWMASANLAEGLRRFVKNSQLINTAMQIELIETEDELIIQYQNKLNTTTQKVGHPCAIQLGIGFFLKMFRLAAAKNIPATGVFFTFQIGEALPIYQEYFQCPIHENSKKNAISFSKLLLNELLPTHDAELVELNEMAVKKYLSTMKNGEITSQVTKLIAKLLPTGCPTEEAIACKMHMSKRTLQRKLSAEDQSYKSLLNAMRLVLAKQQLTMTQMPITEITYQLGYSSPSTFARSFKAQTSLSPLEYRTKTI